MPSVILLGCGLSIAVVGALALNRYLRLRSIGNLVVVRRAGLQGNAGWRHGVVHFNNAEMRYYKLRSLRLQPDRRIDRRSITVSGHRELSEVERTFIDEDMRVVYCEVSGVTYEVAMNTRCETALTSWLESAPSSRRKFVYTPQSGPLQKKLR
ncbi:DUF2550 domain-containing protein [Corynebacterium choanae]|uniref:DUF2550 domain-containing protein n=1 Tax=Corynebacterium choanae TaxID=1862358 RepID=A0A3G6JB84_9CORY|nr:DUF2550 domain-containing protein [Corynebacterium choanae]AZA13334.1 hypothetical protein CCHOA_04630 [Corynebacterium choanae]